GRQAARKTVQGASGRGGGSGTGKQRTRTRAEPGRGIVSARSLFSLNHPFIVPRDDQVRQIARACGRRPTSAVGGGVSGGWRILTELPPDTAYDDEAGDCQERFDWPRRQAGKEAAARRGGCSGLAPPGRCIGSGPAVRQRTATLRHGGETDAEHAGLRGDGGPNGGGCRLVPGLGRAAQRAVGPRAAGGGGGQRNPESRRPPEEGGRKGTEE